MNKKEYQEALKNPKWLSKRDSIKKRDKYKCVKCNCTETLHVHHTYYLENKMPWEVPDDCLITLCEDCHEKEHKGKKITSFIKNKPPKKIKNKKKKPSLFGMTKADRDLQDKYDLLKSKGNLPEPTYKPLENIPRKKKRKR